MTERLLNSSLAPTWDMWTSTTGTERMFRASRSP